MHTSVYLSLLLALGFDLAAARPAQSHPRRDIGSAGQKRSVPVWNEKLHRREVPQEHSHEKFLTIVNEFLQKDNPDEIQDAVFGLLGNAAASEGQGKITDTDCLQQATADQAFTNAKAEGDVDGQVGALIYRALERNTGSVGLASVLCTSIKAVNPEIAAITQHQDPASDGAAEINKDIALTLAVQIANVGGDPLDALDSGTFAPGDLNDNTGAGNTCDDADDPVGCIFTDNLIVEDATEDEVLAAVSASATETGAVAAATECLAETEDDGADAETTAATVATATVTATAAGQTATVTATQAAAATATSSASSGGAVSAVGASNLDLGSCSNPTIKFADGLDGRNEPAFQPNNLNDFGHGSALGIQVITDFICQRLDDKCKASQAAISACNQGATAAQGATGQAAADAFNQALGF